jgi:predicted nucleotidyltransferase
LAVKQFARHIRERPEVNLKKYFYVVRPAVALLWLQQRSEQTPPMSLPALLDGVRLPSDVVAAIVDLRARKAEQSEFGTGTRIAALDDFCLLLIQWAEEHLPERTLSVAESTKRDAENIFRESLFGLDSPVKPH